MHTIAKEQGIPTGPGSRAFVLNADMVALLQAVDIGTRPSNVAMEEPVVVFGSGDEAAEAASSEAAVRGKAAVELSVMATGELVDAEIDTDKKGRIVGVLPALPLDPDTEYRLGPSD
jgi:hypothetical protein